MTRAIKSKKLLTPADFSSASIAGTVVTVGYNLGATTWPGKICIWSTPLLILLLPIIFAAFVNRVDNRMARSQSAVHLKELRRMIEKEKDETQRAKLQETFNRAQQDKANRLRMQANQPYEEVPD
ncbi:MULTISPECIES: hypothetical protein [unclassified Streptomyces]|uniref:hypothetical protein n=1 Tax=unclassified Streptomyces TaxID=2593676 RepID=UPI00093CE036|nr:hypothetical protein [Streptomyces sp. CB02058]OKI85886.1 hypothetical protein AMK10_35390 [Streptomyces sp. CB02058]